MRLERTKRQRNTKTRAESLEHQPAVIALQRFMKQNGFRNENKLKLRNFRETGRGVAANKALHSGNTLINVPFRLMVTFNTLNNDPQYSACFQIGSKLKIHDLLAFFLLLEKHKGPTSSWSSYINSLPRQDATPSLPLQLSPNGIDQLPSAGGIKLSAIKSRQQYEESWLRLSESINPLWTCRCCSKTLDRVLNRTTFAWAYTMVNTRAVYVNPQIVRELSIPQSALLLLDEPSMALCPYLDMFNHCDSAQTQAELYFDGADKQFHYKLILLNATTVKKHKQIFISYGSHNNTKLIIEYGFFLQPNRCDTFQFEETTLIKALTLKLDQCQYRFIKQHGFDADLYIDNDMQPSFNLKAFLFTAHNSFNIQQLTCIIYSDSYPLSFYRQLKTAIGKLIRYCLAESESDVKRLQENRLNPLSLLLIDFINYKIDCLERFLVEL